jgi:hypothetical protein
MRIWMMCGVLSLVGSFACMEPPAAEPDPILETAVGTSPYPSEVADEAEALLGSAGSMCCIDYVCPTNGFETTGCKAGLYGPGIAFAKCERACDTDCDAGEWYCL